MKKELSPLLSSCIKVWQQCGENFTNNYVVCFWNSK
jgi:hypothetical protein